MTSIGSRRFPATSRLMTMAALLMALTACSEQPQQIVEVARQVEAVPATASTTANIARLSGELQAANEAELGFRISGKVIERLVDVGDSVVAGQVLAKLDAQNENNALTAAKAIRLAAIGETDKTRIAFERQDSLMRQGFTTRRQFDQAVAAKEVAQARLNDAEAQVSLAQDRVDFTQLRADAPGVVTSRSIAAGEVVQAGQVVIRLARDGGRDAVFDVSPRFLDQKPENGLIRVHPVNDPKVIVTGRVREISPQADAVTGTFRVRVGLDKTDAVLQLGSTVVGILEKSTGLVVSIPSSALMVMGGSPAVWVVDPATSRVALRHVDVARFEYSRVVVAQGLEASELVVTGGVQALFPGQLVKVLPPSGARKVSLSEKSQAAMACLGNACEMRRRLATIGTFKTVGEIDG